MTDQAGEVFIAASIKRMQLSETDINRCLDKLTDEQMLCRGGDHENSIANLLLHLEGNLRQWFLHGIGGQPDVRRRDEEFALSQSLPCAEIRAALQPPSQNRKRSSLRFRPLACSKPSIHSLRATPVQ